MNEPDNLTFSKAVSEVIKDEHVGIDYRLLQRGYDGPQSPADAFLKDLKMPVKGCFLPTPNDIEQNYQADKSH